jgi:hypothetical protein
MHYKLLQCTVRPVSPYTCFGLKIHLHGLNAIRNYQSKRSLHKRTSLVGHYCGTDMYIKIIKHKYVCL